MQPFTKINASVAAIGLLMACSATWAQTPAKPASAPAPAAKPAAPAAKPAPAPNSSPAACVAEMAKANTGFGAALASGVKAGKIDAKEKAALDAKHAALMKKEAAAKADGKLTAAECNGILANIKAEHAALNQAMASAPAKPAAPAANSSPAACVAAMGKENAAFGVALAAGVKAGKIDAKEKADLDAKHASLIKKEAAAKADGKLTAAECKGVLADIQAERAALNRALASAPAKPAAPAAKPAAPAAKPAAPAPAAKPAAPAAPAAKPAAPAAPAAKPAAPAPAPAASAKK